jgi:lantibiotic modifying enzyme
MLSHVDDAGIRGDIDVALKKTLESGFGAGHSLCHGNLGNLELFLKASHVLGSEALREKTAQIAASILADVNERGVRTGVPLGVETPGLMTGIAGIGYQFLRLAAPEQVPSVLLLEPPIQRGDTHA